MVKIRIVGFKNSLKYVRFLAIIVSLLAFYFLYNSFNSTSKSYSMGLNTSVISCLDENIPGINTNKFNIPATPDNILQEILYSELPILNNSYIISSNSSVSTASEIEKDDSEKLEYAKDNLSTSVIENNVPNTFTNNYDGVEIKNGTNYTLDNSMLTPNININTSNIIVFHSHTCESYTKSEKYQYEESGTFRTIDLERSVAKVGSELSKYLISYGYKVVHDTTYHDYPAYTGSYGRSMATVENLLLSNPGTDIIIDIHRDAIGDTSYAPSVKIGDDVVSQLMFVIGTDGGGLEHPHWQDNLRFAIKVQETANKLYPGLFRPIILRNSRYNQQLGKAACIIEVGATGNTLDQSILSMKYLSKVLNTAIKN